ncbi:MAG: hypothetical protein C4294_18495 [Nitrospiraceae bacterium]
MKEKTFEQILQDQDDMMNATDLDAYVNPVLMDGYQDKLGHNSRMLKLKTVVETGWMRAKLGFKDAVHFGIAFLAVVVFIYICYR